MRHIFICMSFMLGGITVSGQHSRDTLGGEVSYKTSQNIYVRFHSTRDIDSGDTLYVVSEGRLFPSLIVKYTSSTSCVGTPITDQSIETGTRIVALIKSKAAPPMLRAEIADETIQETELYPAPEDEVMIEKATQKKEIRKGEQIKGRITAASYVYFSDLSKNDKQRMRYTLNFNARHMGNTNLSAETYISFRHTLNEWQEVKNNFKRAFKIYSLALQYDVNDETRIWAGRKINFNISNIGAIDGLQAEKKWNKFLTGAFAGSRPDHTDYGFNFDLIQYGAYVGHTIVGKNGTVQHTLAIAEQRNHKMTDRRFMYFQHVNSAIRRFNVFTSFEFDLYKFENDKPQNTLDITSIYASLRYKVSDKLSVFGSYDARKNIIYYETYKNFIDQLLEDETRQGYRFSFNYRPLKRVTLGSSAGYRFQKSNPVASKNLHSYLTVSRIPGWQGSGTLSAVLIQSPYLEGKIFGIRTSRDIIKGKLFGEAEYRWVEYRYKNIETPMNQSIIGTRLSYRVTKKLSLSANYEGEIRNHKIANRIYTNVIQRF